jgi:hypothetical protein
MTHSFVVTSEGAAKPSAGAIAAIFDAFAALMARVGGAGAMFAGEPALDGVDTAGEVMSLIRAILDCRQQNQRRTLGFGVEDTIKGLLDTSNCCDDSRTTRVML